MKNEWMDEPNARNGRGEMEPTIRTPRFLQTSRP